MDLYSVPPASRKFVQLVRPPEFIDQILNYGSWVVTTIPRLLYEGVRLWEERHVPVLIRLTENDLQGFGFPAGHPEIGTVYTAHPYAEDRYCVTASFHRRLFEERIAELARVMRCAGAKSLTIDAAQSVESEAEAIAKLRTGIMEADPSLRVREITSSKLILSLSGGQGQRTELPGDLLFFWAEPTWRELYDAAVTSGIEKYDLEIEDKDDHGLTGEVAGKFMEHNFNIGGKYERHLHYHLKVRVDFGGSTAQRLR